jgi:preprotein translocase subunit SecE
MTGLGKYFRDTWAELKQVTWPTQLQAARYTALVIGISTVVAVFLGAFDYLFTLGINAFVGIFH